mmetsp:Transcript_5029/g.14241  ORF Transcript_5029/g.14241 Transcript_5029/m.14241 type:complete len:705 (-) Transcript_5029:146-2260(-)
MHAIAKSAISVDKVTGGSIKYNGLAEAGAKEAEQTARYGISYFTLQGICFLLLALVFTMNALLARSDAAYLFTDATYQAVGSALDDVSDSASMFAYIEGTFIPKLYPESTDPNAAPGTALAGVKIGVPRVRSLRLGSDTCEIASKMEDTLYRCVTMQSLRSDNDESLEGFEMAPAPADLGYEYVTDAPVLYGWQGKIYYPGSGFVVELGNTAQNATDALTFMKDNSFIDWGTRAVFIEFSIYNPNADLMNAGVIFFEYSPAGAVMPSYKFIVTPYYRYQRAFEGTSLPADFTVFLFELMVYIMAIIIGIFECIEISETYKWGLFAYWRESTFHVIGHVSLALVFSKFVVSAILMADAADAADMTAETSAFVDTHNYSLLFVRQKFIDAALAFMLVLNTLKFLRWHKRFKVFIDTTSRSGTEILLLAIVLMVILMGYGIAFHMFFGMNLRSYYDFTNTMMTLFSTTLGSFNFGELRIHNRIMGPVLFGTFIVIVVFIVLSMLYAIVCLEYADAKEGKVNLSNQKRLMAALRDHERSKAVARDMLKIQTTFEILWTNFKGMFCSSKGAAMASLKDADVDAEVSRRVRTLERKKSLSVMDKLRVIKTKMGEQEDDAEENRLKAIAAAQAKVLEAEASRVHGALAKEGEEEPLSKDTKQLLIQELVRMEDRQKGFTRAMEQISKKCRESTILMMEEVIEEEKILAGGS